MPRVTAAQAAEKWKRRLAGAQPDIRNGVQRVTDNPAQSAIRSQDKMRARVVEAIDSGKWANSLGRVSLEDWKNATLEKGLTRLQAGVDGAGPKVEAFMAELLPYQESLQGRIDGMADLTLEDSVARATAWIRGMAEFKRS